jgi:hypothetical protein
MPSIEWNRRLVLFRRTFFLLVGLLSLYVYHGIGSSDIGLVILAICLCNVFIPGHHRWKTGALGTIAAFFLLCMIIMSNVAFGSVIQYPVFVILGLVAMLVCSIEWLFLGFAALLVLLPAESIALTYSKGFAVVIVMAFSWLAIRLKRAAVIPKWFDSPEDGLVLLVLSAAPLIGWFFFLPPVLPTSLLDHQRGVQMLLAVDRNAAVRKFLFLRHPAVADELPGGQSVLAGVKYSLSTFGRTRNAELDLGTGNFRAVSTDMTAYHLPRCPGEEWIRLRSTYIPPDLHAPLLSYCMSRAGLFFMGGDKGILLLELSSGRILIHETDDNRRNLAKKFAPFGVGRLARFSDDGRLDVGTYEAGASTMTWSPTPLKVDSFAVDDIVIGGEGQNRIYLVRCEGLIQKIEPGAFAPEIERRVFPGVRFTTFVPELKVLCLVNTWVGMVEILDADSLKTLDTFFVGHQARRVNMSFRKKGLAYMITNAGIVRLDLCARLPDRCL